MKNKKITFIAVAIILFVLVTLTVVLICAFSGKKYRLIKVSSFDGTVTINRLNDSGSERFAATKGMRLLSQDTVNVENGSFLELLADDDKHIGASENTGFILVSEGNKSKGKIRIELLYGKALFTIEKKLNEKSSFEVQTPNAVLSVRGTKFYVVYDAQKQETIVAVLDGLVHAAYGNLGADVPAGEMLIIRPDGVSSAQFDVTRAENEGIDAIIPSTSNQVVFDVQRQYYSRDDIENSYITLYSYLYETQGEGAIYQGNYTNQPNTRFEGGDELVTLLSEQFELEYFEAHKSEIDRYFLDNWESASRIYENGGQPEPEDVTSWFPEEITFDSPLGMNTYQIAKVEMLLSFNATRPITNEDGTRNDPSEYEFVDGNNYAIVQTVSFRIYMTPME